MPRSLALPVLTLSLALVTAGVVPALAATNHPSTPALLSLTLNRTDVSRFYGAGFTGRSATYTNLQAAQSENVPPAVLTREGRVNGYQSLFTRTSSRQGASVVGDEVSMWKTKPGAHWEMTHLVSLKSFLAGSARLTPFSVKGLGNEAAGYTTNLKVQAGRTYDLVFFRRGRYTALLSVLGIGALPQSRAVQLAMLLDQRILHYIKAKHKAGI